MAKVNIIRVFAACYCKKICHPQRDKGQSMSCLVKSLNTGTDMIEQAVKFQIRLLLEEQSDLEPHCLPFSEIILVLEVDLIQSYEVKLKITRPMVKVTLCRL